MAQKKKKNSNYVTEKTIQEQLNREKARKAKQTKKLILLIVAGVVGLALLVTLGIGISHVINKNKSEFKVTHHAEITIANYGTLHIELYGEEAPETVKNFVTLANSGYYNGTTFHKIINNFMAQGGKGDTTDSITGEFESNGIENNIKLSRGTIAMARTDDPDSASAQFFIVQNTERGMKLQGDYAGFGRVTSGMGVIDNICKNAKPYDNNGSILPGNQPIITSITIHAAH